MSIRFRCPHGHTLKVEDGLAGKRCRCPRCSAMVTVPRPPPREDGGPDEGISEEAIIDILGGPPPASTGAGEHGTHGSRSGGPPGGAEDRDPRSHDSPPMKNCARCNQPIPASTHICPHCHTYVTDVSGR